jgi:glycosyltransferase involved in cell wall biosynthesis
VYNQLDRWSLPSANKVLTVSRPFRDELVGFGVPADQIEVIHNAIAPNWGESARMPAAASALREHAGILPDRRVILIVGRLSREKDHLTLLDAVAGLRSDLDPHLVIVGDGPERARIEQRMNQLGIGDLVTMAGHQASAQAWYGIANVAVLSSLSEGSPNALLEAMASGIPAVATEVGGIPEIVAHEDSALLVQPGKADEMEAALRRVLTEPALAARLATRSKVLIAERHAPEARMKRLVAVYRSLLA